ncbi:transcription factor BTF3 homolog 4-like [Paramacrobiotus metropolitanus]|uniref:transcription factor BTF3 homolog 4-like n=1 Tax=Paramacrobiotus metropolitanus TaxID=2943436 RepID=UPI002445A753|nr:transcription factor BTF3 homolog 4-like [Paramacrobiotus metropolitanus]
MADQLKSSTDEKPKPNTPSERLQQLQKLQDQVRIGGKGTARRKKKVMHHPVVKDDKQLINTLKKLGANPIPGIEEVNLFKDNNTVTVIKNPKVQTALACNTFSVAGTAVEKPASEVVPSFNVNSMHPDNLMQLRNLGNLLNRARQEGKMGGGASAPTANDDDVPVPQENFDQNA